MLASQGRAFRASGGQTQPTREERGNERERLRVTEVIGASPDSWEAAAQNAVSTAGQTIRDLRVAEATRFDVTIEDGKISSYRVRVWTSRSSTTRATRTTQPRFDGKVLFATGGASGLAAATVRRFAAEGGRVAVVDLDRERAEAVASGLDGSIALGLRRRRRGLGRGGGRSAERELGRIDCVLNAPASLSSFRSSNFRSTTGTGCSPYI